MMPQMNESLLYRQAAGVPLSDPRTDGAVCFVVTVLARGRELRSESNWVDAASAAGSWGRCGAPLSTRNHPRSMLWEMAASSPEAIPGNSSRKVPRLCRKLGSAVPIAGGRVRPQHRPCFRAFLPESVAICPLASEKACKSVS